MNIWATETIDWAFFDAEWEQLFGNDDPAMTIGYIAEIGLPAIKIEIEIWAAKVQAHFIKTMEHLKPDDSMVFTMRTF